MNLTRCDGDCATDFRLVTIDCEIVVRHWHCVLSYEFDTSADR